MILGQTREEELEERVLGNRIEEMLAMNHGCFTVAIASMWAQG